MGQLLDAQKHIYKSMSAYYQHIELFLLSLQNITESAAVLANYPKCCIVDIMKFAGIFHNWQEGQKAPVIYIPTCPIPTKGFSEKVSIFISGTQIVG